MRTQKRPNLIDFNSMKTSKIGLVFVVSTILYKYTHLTILMKSNDKGVNLILCFSSCSTYEWLVWAGCSNFLYLLTHCCSQSVLDQDSFLSASPLLQGLSHCAVQHVSFVERGTSSKFAFWTKVHKIRFNRNLSFLFVIVGIDRNSVNILVFSLLL